MSDGYTDGWRAAAKAADVVIEVPGGGPMFFRRVPKGEFWMGSRDPHPENVEWTQNELPRHRVVVEREFWMATFPVTRRQFDAWANPGAKAPKEQLQRPAVNMDWHQATEFCAWLAQQEGWRGYCPALPSEAEWEYACRAGTDTDYCSGDGEAALREVGWFDRNSGNRTHDVGERQPNAWGLYDMHGNVGEWCRDPWCGSRERDTGELYRSRIDGTSLEQVQPDWAAADFSDLERSQAGRVFRGGSWSDPAWWCRSACRFGWGPGNRFVNQGFRVCLLPGPSGQAG